MADILKITTPLVNKNPVEPNKQVTDPTVPFNLQDISKVVKSNPDSELLKQNNGMLQKDEAPSVLMNLLKDPAVTVSFLKNIFMLQEIIKLLPVNNNTFTQEIQQLFDALLIKPDEIAAEMMKQEQTSTSFKGELFNFLRSLVNSNPSPEMKYAVANLLKSINVILVKRDILNSVANSLQFLSEGLKPSKKLSSKLKELCASFRQADAEKNFGTLKKSVLQILDDVENSILFSSKMLKVVPIIKYNLSRFNDNPDFLQEAISGLLLMIDGKQQKTDFLKYIKSFIEDFSGQKTGKETSKIMNVLADIIGKETSESSITLLNSEKIEKIIHSLLSSPCNFTPLLHFVIPVQDMDIRSFAEIWINPNGSQDESDTEDENCRCTHVLVVFDIDGIGQFEAELFVKDFDIQFQLFCPEQYIKEFSEIKHKFSKLIENSEYRFVDVAVKELERPRSLMDVFKSLPYKRTGVNVKI